MSNLLLYSIVIFSWGTSWLAIKFQLGEVHPQMSVGYRFILSGMLILAYCLLRKKSLKFSLQQHGWIAVQAFFMFSTNYIFIYKSSQNLASGLVSVVFSTLTFMNILNMKLFFKQSPKKETLLATCVGFVGILLVFQRELQNLNPTGTVVLGLVFGLIASYSASLGNITSAKNQKEGLPILQSTGLGMFYGGVWTLICALIMGHPLTFSWTPGYVLSLVHLSVFASILAFISYLTLLSRMGASRAAYCALVFPVIAIALSVIFENYQVNAMNGLGFFLILAGNYIIMFKPDFLTKMKSVKLEKETKENVC